MDRVGRLELRRRSSVKDLAGFFEDFHQKRRERFGRQLKKTLSAQKNDTGRESPRLPSQFRHRAQSVPVYYSSSGPEESDGDDNESVHSISRDWCQATSNVLPPLDENTGQTIRAGSEVGGTRRSDFSNLLSDPERVESEKTVIRSCVTEDTLSPTGATGPVTRPRVGALSYVDIMETLPEMDQVGIDKKGNVKSVKAVVFSMEHGRISAYRRTGAASYKRQATILYRDVLERGRVANLVKTFNQKAAQGTWQGRTRKSHIRRGSVDSIASLEVTLPVKNSPFYRYERSPSPSPVPFDAPEEDGLYNKSDVKNCSSDDILSLEKVLTEPVRLSVKERVQLFSSLGCGVHSSGKLKVTSSRSRFFRHKTPQQELTALVDIPVNDPEEYHQKSGAFKRIAFVQNEKLRKSLTMCSLSEASQCLLSDSDTSDEGRANTDSRPTSNAPDFGDGTDTRDSGIANEDDDAELSPTAVDEVCQLLPLPGSSANPEVQVEGQDEEQDQDAPPATPSPSLVVTDDGGLVQTPEAADGSDSSDDSVSRRYSKVSQCSSCSSVAVETPQEDVAEVSTSSVVAKRQKSNTLSSDVLRSMLSPMQGGALKRRASLVETDLLYADALWDQEPSDTQELSFKANDVIEVLDMSDDDWWYGCVGCRSGWFPASFVRLRVGLVGEENGSGEEVKETAKEPSQPPPQEELHKPSELDMMGLLVLPEDKLYGSAKRRKTTIRRNQQQSAPRKLSPQEVRAKVVEEILCTEREYVQSLEDIVEGYLQRCRQHLNLFPEERTDKLFANVESLLMFQKTFLADLESQISQGEPWNAQIGQCFLRHSEEFARYYSEYCNNHPFANGELADLNDDPRYSFFFESCRLLRNMPDLPLDSFLLKPVQKICKYPLQLTELLKYTDRSHPDSERIKSAVDGMKEVAQTVNERKRRVENIHFIGKWRRSVDNWEGDDILERSSELIHSGELVKISKGHAQERHFFLFDHQLVYCKKDAIGSRYTYKGRILTDVCNIIDLEDGEVQHGGHPVKHAWKVNNVSKQKWYILYARSAEVKREWLEAFARERLRVKEDQESGYEISQRLKKAAFEGALTISKKKKAAKAMAESVDGGAKLKGKGSPALSGNKVMKRKSFSTTRRIDTSLKVK